MNLLIRDDFFDQDIAQKLREIALSLDYTTDREMSERMGNRDGWKGSRTKKIAHYDKFFLYSCEQKVFKATSEFFDFKKLKITSYFHMTFEDTKKSENYIRYKYHRDFSAQFAGIIYLTPDAPLEMGTSILDEENNKIINVENVYNRLVAYPSSYLHAVSDVFGKTKESARMTFTFFIHDKDTNLDIGNP